MKVSRLFMVGGLCSLFALTQNSPASAHPHPGWGGGYGPNVSENWGWGPYPNFGGYGRGWQHRQAPGWWNAQSDVLIPAHAGPVPHVQRFEGPAPQGAPRRAQPGEGLAGPVDPRGPRREFGPQGPGQGRGFGMGPQGPRHEGGPRAEGFGRMGRRGEGPGFGGPRHEGGPGHMGLGMGMGMGMRGQGLGGPGREGGPAVGPRPGRRIIQMLERQNPEIAAKTRERLQAGKPPREVFNNALNELAESDNPENKAFAQRIRERLEQGRPFDEEFEPRPGMRMRLQQQAEGDGEGRQERRVRIMEHRGPGEFEGPRSPEVREDVVREFRLSHEDVENVDIAAHIKRLELRLEMLKDQENALMKALEDLRAKAKQSEDGDRDAKIEKKDKDDDSDSDDDEIDNDEDDDDNDDDNDKE